MGKGSPETWHRAAQLRCAQHSGPGVQKGNTRDVNGSGPADQKWASTNELKSFRLLCEIY